MWSDGSRLDNGQTGAGVVWQELSGTWTTKQVSLGQGKEVFDAELAGVYKALEIAEQLDYKGPIRVLLDSQAAIARLRDNRTGAGQRLPPSQQHGAPSTAVPISAVRAVQSYKDIDQNLPFFGEVDGAYKKNGRSYKAPGECLSAREPQPSTTKPGETVPALGVSQTAGQQWKGPDPSKCRDSKSGTEDCLGTQRYCAPGARAVKDEAKRAEAQKDCEASRGRHPSAAQPPQRPVSHTNLKESSPSSKKISGLNMQTSHNMGLGNGQAKPDIDAYDRIPI
ncbi:hypothetical protein BDV24DRAFT_169288 [Aspergillus arachidicola]|uniref:RNase H type-1 domain-containing protein n=1 Tax=Aspergillus arachidicola TaxID=656916 RepID=A0A5N6XSI5_9EURO|nr:hypothetical protein BDV24DRAFT_169288 [Aspergillus arachidicola]